MMGKESLSEEQVSQRIIKRKELDLLYYKLCSKYTGYADLLATTQEVIDLCKEVLQHAHKFDFRGTPANGFRSLVNKVIDLLYYLMAASVTDIDAVNQMMRELASHADTMRQVLNSAVSEVPALEIERMVDAVHHFATDDRLMSIIFNNVTLLFDLGRLGRFLTAFAFWFISFVVSNSWSSSFWCMMSRSARERTVREYYRTCPLEKLVHLLSYSKSLWQERIVPFLAFGIRPSVRKFIRVPRQYHWIVCLDTRKEKIRLSRIRESQHLFSDMIDCCIMRQNVGKSQSQELKDVVLVYVMGGGFISNSVQSTNSFLPALCAKMPGLTTLTIGLSSAPDHKFPVQVQETLDVYLWLRSQAAERVLGFSPKSILFACDSSGAIITMSTIVILNDVNREIRHSPADVTEIDLPVALIALFPAFHVAPAILPSLCLSCKDLILFPTTLTQMCFSYLPNISNDASIDTTEQLNQPKTWYLNSPEQTKRLLHRYEFVFRSPYYSPVYYERYDELASVQLHVLAAANDPILDSAILMLRRWQGVTSLRVSPHLRHAYFYFTAFATVFFPSVRHVISQEADIFVSRVLESVRSAA